MLISAPLAPDYCDVSAEELLRVCADLRNAAAWDEFIRRFHSRVYAAVLRTGRRYAQFHPRFCDDLVQDTYLRLSVNRARALREFVPGPPGSAYCYVQIIAVRVTQDYCKRKDFQLTHELPAELPDRPAPDKTEWLALISEFDAALRKGSSARDRAIFWLHYLQGMTAKEIAGIAGIGLNVKGVESVLKRLLDGYR